MDVLDLFSRTFLPLAAQAGIPIPTLSRHMPLFRRYADPNDPTMLVTRCARADRPLARPYLLLLTRRHLVVTTESRVLHRPRLHLEARVSALQGVTWQADPSHHSVELAVTTARARERFWIKALHPRQLWRYEAALGYVFRESLETTVSPVGAF